MGYSKFLKERKGRLWFSVLSLGFVVAARNMVSGFDNFKYAIDNSRPIGFDVDDVVRDWQYVGEDVRRNNVDFSNLDFAETDFISEFLLELCYSSGLTSHHTADPKKDFDYWVFKSEIVEKNWSELLRLFFKEGATKLDQSVLNYIEALESARSGQEVQPHLTAQRLLALISSVRAYFEKKTAGEVLTDFPELTNLLSNLLAVKPLKTVDIASGGRMLFGGRSFPMFGRAYGGAFGGDLYGWGFGGAMWKKGSEAGGPEAYNQNSFGSAMWSNFHKEGEPTIGDVKDFCAKYQNLILKFNESTKSSELKRAIGYRILSDYLAKLYLGAGVVATAEDARSLCSYDYVVKILSDCLKFCELVKDFAVSMKAHPGFAKHQLENLNKEFNLHHFPMQCIISIINALFTKVASIDLSLIDATKQPELFRFVQNFKRNNEANKASDSRTFLDLAFTFYTTLTGLWNNEFAKIKKPKKADLLSSIKNSTERNFADNSTNTAFDKLKKMNMFVFEDVFPKNEVKPDGGHPYKKNVFDYFDQLAGSPYSSLAYNVDGDLVSKFNNKPKRITAGGPANFKVESMFLDFMRSFLLEYDNFDKNHLEKQYDKHLRNLSLLMPKGVSNKLYKDFVLKLREPAVKNFIVGMIETLKNFKMIAGDGTARDGDLVYDEWAESVKNHIDSVSDFAAFDFATYETDKTINELLQPDFTTKKELQFDSTGGAKVKAADWAKGIVQIEDKRPLETLKKDEPIDLDEVFREAATKFENNSLKQLFNKLKWKKAGFPAFQRFSENKKDDELRKYRRPYRGEKYDWLKQLVNSGEVRYVGDDKAANFKVDKMLYDLATALFDKVEGTTDVNVVKAKFRELVRVLKAMANSGHFAKIEPGFIDAIEQSGDFIADLALKINEYADMSTDDGSSEKRQQFLNVLKNFISGYSGDKKKAFALAGYKPNEEFENILGFDLSDEATFDDGGVTKKLREWAADDDGGRTNLKYTPKHKKILEDVEEDKTVFDFVQTKKLAEKAIGENAANAVFKEIGLPEYKTEIFKKPEGTLGKIKGNYEKNNFGFSTYKYFKELFKNKDTLKYTVNSDDVGRQNLFEYSDDLATFEDASFMKNDMVKTKTDVMLYNLMNSLFSTVDGFDEAEMRANFKQRIKELKLLAEQKAPDGSPILKNLKLDLIEKIEQSEDFIINLLNEGKNFNMANPTEPDYDYVYSDWASETGKRIREVGEIPFVQYLGDVGKVSPVKIEDVLGFQVDDLNKITTPIFDSNNPGGGKITPVNWGLQSNNLVDDRYESDDKKIGTFEFDVDATRRATLDSFSSRSANATFDEFVDFEPNEKVDINNKLHNYKHSIYNYFKRIYEHRGLRYKKTKEGRKSSFNGKDVKIDAGDNVVKLVENMLFSLMNALCIKIDDFKKEDLGEVFDKHIENLKLLVDDPSQVENGGPGIDSGFIDKLVAAKSFIISLVETFKDYDMDVADYDAYKKWVDKIVGVINSATEEQLAFVEYVPERAGLKNLSSFFGFNPDSNVERNFKKMQGDGAENKKLSEWAAQDFNLVDERNLPDVVLKPFIPTPPPLLEGEKPKPPKEEGVDRDNWFKMQAKSNFRKNAANVLANNLLKNGKKLELLKDDLLTYFEQFAEIKSKSSSEPKKVKNKNSKYFKTDKAVEGGTLTVPVYEYMVPDIVYANDVKDAVCGFDIEDKTKREYEDIFVFRPAKCGPFWERNTTGGGSKVINNKPAYIKKQIKNLVKGKAGNPVKLNYNKDGRAHFKVETMFYNLIKCAIDKVNKFDNLTSSRIAYFIGALRKMNEMQYKGTTVEGDKKYKSMSRKLAAHNAGISCYEAVLDATGEQQKVEKNIPGVGKRLIPVFKPLEYKKERVYLEEEKEQKIAPQNVKKYVKDIEKNCFPKQYIDNDFVIALNKSCGFFYKLLATVKHLKGLEEGSYQKWANAVRETIENATPDDLAFAEYEPDKSVDDLIVMDYDVNPILNLASAIGTTESTIGTTMAEGKEGAKKVADKGKNTHFKDVLVKDADILKADKTKAHVLSWKDRFEAFLRAVQLARELFFVPNGGEKVAPAAAPGAPVPGGGAADPDAPVPGAPAPGGGAGGAGGAGAGAAIKEKNPNKFTAEELKRTNGEALASFVEGITDLRSLINVKDKRVALLNNPNKLKDEDLKRTNGEALQSFVEAMKTLCDMFKPQYKTEKIKRKVEKIVEDKVNKFTEAELKRTNGDMLSSFVSAIKTLRELIKPDDKDFVVNKMETTKITNEERLNSFISAIGTLRELAKPDPDYTNALGFFEQINNGLHEVVFAKDKADVDDKIKFLDDFFGRNFGVILTTAGYKNKIEDLMLEDFNPYSEEQKTERIRGAKVPIIKSCLPTDLYDEMFVGSDLEKKKKFEVPVGTSTKLPLIDGQTYTLGQIIANLTKELPCSFSDVVPDKDVLLQFAGSQADLKIGVNRSGWVKNFISLDELRQLFNTIKDKPIELVNNIGDKYTGTLGEYIGGTIKNARGINVRLSHASKVYVSGTESVEALVKSFGSLKIKRKTEEDLEYGDLNQATNRSLEKILNRYDERVSADIRNFSKRVDRRISEERRWIERKNYLINCYNYLVNKSNMVTQRINQLLGGNYKVYDDLSSNLNLRDKVLQDNLGLIDDPNVVSLNELDDKDLEKILNDDDLEKILENEDRELDNIILNDQPAESNVAANSNEAVWNDVVSQNNVGMSGNINGQPAESNVAANSNEAVWNDVVSQNNVESDGNVDREEVIKPKKLKKLKKSKLSKKQNKSSKKRS